MGKQRKPSKASRKKDEKEKPSKASRKKDEKKKPSKPSQKKNKKRKRSKDSRKKDKKSTGNTIKTKSGKEYRQVKPKDKYRRIKGLKHNGFQVYEFWQGKVRRCIFPHGKKGKPLIIRKGG